MKFKTKTYVISTLVTFAVAGLSALLTSKNMDIYDRIAKPPFAPPGFLFPKAWAILYLIMALSLARVIIKARKDGIYVIPAVSSFALQLFFNFFWSIIFFNMQNFLLSFVWLLFLLAFVGNMILKFYKIDKISALSNIPYFLWVCFAGVLNFAIYTLNK